MAADSSWLDQGTRFLGGLAEAYGTYERARANDLEYQRYDAAPLPRTPGIPGWALVAGGVLAVVVLLRVAR